MATIGPGIAWASGVTFQVNQTNLAAFLTSANVTAVQVADFDTSEVNLFLRAATLPAADFGEGSMWIDPIERDVRVKVRQTGDWHDVRGHLRVKNSGAGVIPLGARVKFAGIDVNNSFLVTLTNTDLEFSLGNARATIDANAFGFVQTKGVMEILVTGLVTPGDQMVTWNVSPGYARSMGYFTASATGLFWGYANRFQGFAMALYRLSFSISTTMTCLVYY